MRVLVVIGTRPEAIKLAPVLAAVRRTPGLEGECCITSQHTDLLRPMLDFFGVRYDYDLSVMAPNQTLAEVTCKVLQGLTDILRQRPYDVVVVQGDTTTAFAAGLAAFYERVPVAHVEAGLRSFDLRQPFPEEANRRFLDVFADYLFVPTEQAAANLLREGADSARIHRTGNTGIDSLLLARDIVRAERRPPPVVLPQGHRLVLVTAHRRESFGPPLERVFRALVALTESRKDVELLVPLHPNPRVREAAERALARRERVHLVEPLEYPDFVAAMLRADLIVTDSGGVQEEAPSLGKRVLVTRETTERPEGLEAGAAELVGTDPEVIRARAESHLEVGDLVQPLPIYGDGQAARRVVEVLCREGDARRAA